MAVNTLYSELYRLLDSGDVASVCSEYRPDGRIERAVSSLSDRTGCSDTLRDEMRQNPAAIEAGPIISLSHEDGSFTVQERFMAKPRLIILGGGHISLALAEIAHLTDFDTVVYEDRPAYASAERFPTASAVLCDSFSNLGNHITFGPSDFVVDVTRGYQNDKECLGVILAGQEPAYTGMIGSQRRVAIVMKQLEDAGYSKERMERIHAPIGLRIGAQTPTEIAISIMAQIIAVKRTEQEKTQWLSGDLELIEAVARDGFVPGALVTVLSTKGSVPTEAGCKLGMTYEGSIAGTIGGGGSEAEAIRIGREVIEEGGWRLVELDLAGLGDDEGMVCGGTMQVLIEKA